MSARFAHVKSVSERVRVDQHTYDATRQQFDFSDAVPVKVKGKSVPINLYTPQHKEGEVVDLKSSGSMISESMAVAKSFVGRTRVLKDLGKLFNLKVCPNNVVIMEGVTGMGKTTTVRHVMNRCFMGNGRNQPALQTALENGPGYMVYLSCQTMRGARAFFLLQKVFPYYWGLKTLEEEVAFISKVARRTMGAVKGVSFEHIREVLCHMLNYKHSDILKEEAKLASRSSGSDIVLKSPMMGSLNGKSVKFSGSSKTACMEGGGDLQAVFAMADGDGDAGEAGDTVSIPPLSIGGNAARKKLGNVEQVSSRRNNIMTGSQQVLALSSPMQEQRTKAETVRNAEPVSPTSERRSSAFARSSEFSQKSRSAMFVKKIHGGGSHTKMGGNTSGGGAANDGEHDPDATITDKTEIARILTKKLLARMSITTRNVHCRLRFLLIDDAHLLDNESWELLHYFSQHCPNLRMVVATQPFAGGNLPYGYSMLQKAVQENPRSPFHVLERLNDVDSGKLVRMELKSKEFRDLATPQCCEQVHAMAKGVPLWIHEVLSGIKAEGMLAPQQTINPAASFRGKPTPRTGSDRGLQRKNSFGNISEASIFGVAKKSTDGDIPQFMTRSILSRFDKLEPDEQHLLKCMSVLAGAFSTELALRMITTSLSSVSVSSEKPADAARIQSGSKAKVAKLLERLHQKDWLSVPLVTGVSTSAPRQYDFAHSVVRRVLRRTLRGQQRKGLNILATHNIREEFEDDLRPVYDILCDRELF